MAEVLGEAIDTRKFNGISNDKDFEPVLGKSEKPQEADEEDNIAEGNGEEEEEDAQEDGQEDSSPSDYEFSLREENIRLKSRLEQAKEGMVTVEKQCKRIKEELEKEKKFGDKANSTIYSLMQEKQKLQEKVNMARPQSSSIHHEGIQEVVRKLEREIQILEERLDCQRKRNHQEHLLMYEDLKEERSKRQEWKQTYLKSQVAVMAFRRKLGSMKSRLSEEDIKELSKCLELVFHEHDGRLKQDLIAKNEELCVEGSSKYAAHLNNTYKISKEFVKMDKEFVKMDKEFVKMDTNEQNTFKMSKDFVKMDTNEHNTFKTSKDFVKMDANDLLITDVKSKVTIQTDDNIKDDDPSTIASSLKHAFNDGGDQDDPNVPKVFIMDDENVLVDPLSIDKPPPPRDDVNVKLPPMATNPTARTYNFSSQRYELAGTRHHHHSFSSTQHDHRQSQDRNPHYKHWHHYSVDNPGHNRKLEVGSFGSASDRYRDTGNAGNKKSLSNTLLRLEDRSYKSRNSKFSRGFNDQLELNVNDTKFLELNFDHAFLKGDYKPGPGPSKLAKSLQKNGVRNEVVDKKITTFSGDEKKLYCLTCDLEVPDKSCGHANIVVQEKDKEFPCPTCARIFTNRSHLKRHNMIHSGEKPWACTYCDKRFNRKSHLSRHLLTHTGEKPFKCPTCGKGFADNSDLKRHKQIHEATPGLVPILPKDNQNQINPPNPMPSNPMPSIVTAVVIPLQPITSISKLTIPKRKDVRFPCSKCGKQFSRKSHLTRHKLTHEQMKIYCDCGRIFRQNAHLQAHLPACKRKREAVEAKYKAELESKNGDTQNAESQNAEAYSATIKTEDTSMDSPSQLPVTGRNTTDTSIVNTHTSNNNGVTSVNDFRARLAAKFNEGDQLSETKLKEEELSKQVILENKIKEEKLDDEVSSEMKTDGIVGQEPNNLVEPNMAEQNLPMENSIELNSREEQFVVIKPAENTAEQNLPLGKLPDQYIANQKLTVHKLNEHKFTDQKMADINFNLIVKNGTYPKLQNDDLTLGVDSLPSLPIEIPPLLNEPLEP